MTWKELRKRGNKIYHLAHHAKKSRVRKKNLRRLERFKKKHNIPVGPIPDIAKGRKWNESAYSGRFATECSLINTRALGAELAFCI